MYCVINVHIPTLWLQPNVAVSYLILILGLLTRVPEQLFY